MPKIKTKATRLVNPEKGLSKYEKERLKRIEANESFLKSLNIIDAKKELQQLTKKTQFSRPSRFPKEPPPPSQPCRASLRLRSLQPDGITPAPSVQAPPQPPSYPSYPIRKRPSGPIQLHSELIPWGKTKGQRDEEEEGERGPPKMAAFLKGLSSQRHEEDKCKDWSSSYEKEVSRLELKQACVTKVTKEKIYSLAFHPSKSKLLVAAGDRDGGIGIWDIDSELGDADSLVFHRVHSSPVKSVVFPTVATAANALYSCSYDGSIRRLDLEKNVFEEVFATAEGAEVGVSHLSLESAGRWMLAACSSGEGLLVDERASRRPLHAWDLHRRKIKTVQLCPPRDCIFTTACVDGTVMTWDMRSMKSKSPEPLQLVHTAAKSVSSAYFSADGTRLLTTSMDNMLNVFESRKGSPGEDLRSTLSLNHNNHTGRWLVNFRAVFDPKSCDHFVVGSMARPRQVEVYSVGSRHPVHRLDGEWLTSVCSINACHPHTHVIAGANSSGRVHVWRRH